MSLPPVGRGMPRGLRQMILSALLLAAAAASPFGARADCLAEASDVTPLASFGGWELEAKSRSEETDDEADPCLVLEMRLPERLSLRGGGGLEDELFRLEQGGDWRVLSGGEVQWRMTAAHRLEQPMDAFGGYAGIRQQATIGQEVAVEGLNLAATWVSDLDEAGRRQSAEIRGSRRVYERGPSWVELEARHLRGLAGDDRRREIENHVRLGYDRATLDFGRRTLRSPGTADELRLSADAAVELGASGILPQRVTLLQERLQQDRASTDTTTLYGFWTFARHQAEMTFGYTRPPEGHPGWRASGSVTALPTPVGNLDLRFGAEESGETESSYIALAGSLRF